MPSLQHALRSQPGNASAVLFGGVLRDLAIFGPAAQPRDIDVVVTGVSEALLFATLQPFVQRRTRFGGLQLSSAGVEVDLWPLESTWGLTHLRIFRPSFADLPNTTFLDIEAVVAGVPLRGQEPGPFHEAGFFDSIERRTIDINLEANPYPLLCLAKSLNLASRLGFSIGPGLSQFAYDLLSTVKDADLAVAHAGVHSGAACNSCLYRGWREMINKFGPGQVVPPPTISQKLAMRGL